MKQLICELSLCVLTVSMLGCSGGSDLPADADAPGVRRHQGVEPADRTGVELE